jgi:Fe-S oxidoreductase
MSLADHAPVYELCRYCLMCRHVCPVGRTTRRETTTPHGWALLIASVDRGQLRWDSEAVDTLYQCAQCGLCLSNCVTDQPLPSAIAAARADVVSKGLAPQSVTDLDARLRHWGNPYQESAPLVSSGMAPAALFVGAAAQLLRPQTLDGARKLLRALGVEYVPVGVGLSSAYLPFALGLRETAEILARAALQEITAARSSRLILLTPEDARAFTDALPQLGLQLPEGVEPVELTTLLAAGVQAGQLNIRPLDVAVTYHDPAHTPHFPARAGQARRVLSALFCQPVREMFWREGRAAPGGAVGGLEFIQPALAETMARDRVAEAVSTGAELLVTEDPVALTHLEQHAAGTAIKVVGLYELLAGQLA